MAETKTVTQSPTASIELLADLVDQAIKVGATAADAVAYDSISLSVSQRMGKKEELERAEGREIGLRTFHGQRQAIVSTTECSTSSLVSLAQRAVDMARAAPEDPYCGLADPKLLARDFPDLELFDGNELSSDELYELSAEAEESALAVDGVTNSNRAGASWSCNTKTLVTSDHFKGEYKTSSHSVLASVVAGKSDAMETDYAFSRTRFSEDLISPNKIGAEAGERSVHRLNPTKINSGAMPVVFEPRVANSIVRHLTQAISGTAIARRTSFLRKDLNQKVFGKDVTITDDPHRKRGVSSRPFDDEGINTQQIDLVKNGILTSWILSSDSSRQLKLNSTGHAQRAASSPPAPSASNIFINSGTISPKDLISDIKHGVLITELIGFGVNIVTGDYSRGAAGFIIDHGEIAGAVSEFTIAGNLREMFREMIPADDLIFQFGQDSPTLRIDCMTVAGK